MKQGWFEWSNSFLGLALKDFEVLFACFTGRNSGIVSFSLLCSRCATSKDLLLGLEVELFLNTGAFNVRRLLKNQTVTIRRTSLMAKCHSLTRLIRRRYHFKGVHQLDNSACLRGKSLQKIEAPSLPFAIALQEGSWAGLTNAYDDLTFDCGIKV